MEVHIVVSVDRDSMLVENLCPRPNRCVEFLRGLGRPAVEHSDFVDDGEQCHVLLTRDSSDRTPRILR